MARIALTQKEFEEKVKISSPNLIIKGKFINTRTDIEVQCRDCGYEWTPRANTLLIGNEKSHVCPNCNKVTAVHKKDLYDLLDKESTEIFPLFLKEYDNEVIKSKDDILIYDNRCKHYYPTNYNRIHEQGVKCPFCANKKVWRGFNDIATTDPWMINIMKNKKDAFKYTRGSNKKIDWVCPTCNSDILNKCINDVWKRGLACTKCSDGRSYPEKLVANLLDELKVEFKPQFTIEGYPYIYDFYLPNFNCIIETHGNQHYNEHGFGIIHENARSLEEEQENDRLKEELAKSLGFNYIVIDCRNSDYEYIKKSIVKTKFCSILNTDITNVDFVSLHIKSMKSNYLKVCELYNKGTFIQDIMQQVHLTEDTVRKYLRDATKNGICNYDGMKDAKEKLQEYNNNTKKLVRCITTNLIFDSIKNGALFYNIHPSQLSRHLNNPSHNFFAGYDKDTGEKLIWEFV